MFVFVDTIILAPTSINKNREIKANDDPARRDFHNGNISRIVTPHSITTKGVRIRIARQSHVYMANKYFISTK